MSISGLQLIATPLSRPPSSSYLLQPFAVTPDIRPCSRLKPPAATTAPLRTLAPPGRTSNHTRVCCCYRVPVPWGLAQPVQPARPVACLGSAIFAPVQEPAMTPTCPHVAVSLLLERGLEETNPAEVQRRITQTPGPNTSFRLALRLHVADLAMPPFHVNLTTQRQHFNVPPWSATLHLISLPGHKAHTLSRPPAQGSKSAVALWRHVALHLPKKTGLRWEDHVPSTGTEPLRE
ncbi:hypothetical protein BGZ61DRAFT_476951 [Ilyonectria robusta]|uniref:uncharacterized protein n=1 Tax=Ilyonectria robusta TaxID=1079257 RepID=UPI001E8D411C|nr:uncharacterized protein BGZ61DRAFT_476951 [Ilyonectria robusta]KAH8706292.1 hypothetical protein BGZ61DRAFT_476951 [Ilyonectria robusta]